jgi:hypothetical protein
MAGVFDEAFHGLTINNDEELIIARELDNSWLWRICS